MQLIVGHLQHYDWGSRDAIAHIQNRAPTGRPEAELWFGAHPSGPATVEDYGVTLDQYITDDPATALGAPVVRHFGGLPYLVKVLSARQSLSIQLHPTKRQAEAGFLRENHARIAIDAPNRTYRDDNHKPELICALTAFEARSGFRPVAGTVDYLRRMEAAAGEPGPPTNHPYQQWRALLDQEQGVDLREVVRWLLALPPEDGAELVDVLRRHSERWLNSVSSIPERASGADATPERGASAGHRELERLATWTPQIAQHWPGDSGVAVAFLLNHVVLEPGEALFVGPGVLHAYLQGTGVEIMANSDNVVRGGLTAKHVDLAELVRLVDPEPIIPTIQQPVGPIHRYHSPVGDFSLTRYGGPKVVEVTPHGPEILLVTSGTASLQSAAGQVEVKPGYAAFVDAADGNYQLTTQGERSVVWRTTVGQQDC